ncbi:hypothetical protein COZ63_01120 [Candidatus Berkelbacteria bacterium CG_4_8_14_3_um_filter_42_13]|uniref:Acyl-phosphate glycerol 3-phosphate acyltransferase n=1 Tax=Candidatus Berkelbacteria bacterium CG_4_8_14_3_um_filter_42_13 TaxID=1974505 RepID=A0A2M7K1R5_9BACT|nr:MAG: hypothetical protein COZ63_01120 [Candidatus Berkelbacteria bacterium CG_4_8_14_3_um_filter_42_13]
MWAYLAGIAAIIGHIFPFYLGFRGGQGTATAVGLLFYFAIKLGLLSAIGWSGFLPGLITTAILVLSILFIMRDERALGIFALPSFIFFLLMNTRQDLELYFLTAILFFIIGINILVIHQQKVFALRIPEDKFEHLLNWRTFARPLAILFIVFIYIWPKTTALYRRRRGSSFYFARSDSANQRACQYCPFRLARIFETERKKDLLLNDFFSDRGLFALFAFSKRDCLDFDSFCHLW